jgi:sugar lactone lactonase YvrE
MQSLGRSILGILAACLLAASALAHPGSGINTDRLGQIYFLDTGSGLWRIDTRGGLTHISPLRNHWFALDPNNRFTQAKLPADPGRDWALTAAGSDPTAVISTDFPLMVGTDGYLYYPSSRETNVRLLRLDANGRTSEFLRLPRSVAGTAIGWINGITMGPDGSIYYTEDTAVRRISRSKQVTTIATVTPLAVDPRIPGSEKRPYLRGIKVDANGNVYVADNGDARVLKVAPDGKMTTLLQLESPWAPTDVAVHDGIVYVLEYLHTPGDDRLEWMPRIRKITPDGRSAIILTIDQMPNARPPDPAATPASQQTSTFSLWDMLLLPINILGLG